MAITFEASWSNGADKAVSTSPSAFKTGTSGYTPVVEAACLMQHLNVVSMSRAHLDIDTTLPVLATIQGQDPVSRNLCTGLHNSAPSAAPRLWGFSFDSKPLDSIIHALHPCTTLLLQRLSQRGEALPPRASAWALVWAASGVSGPERNYLAAQLNELGAGEIAHLSLAM